MSYQSTAAPLGFSVAPYRNRVIVRGGAKVKGDVVQLDIAKSDAATTDAETGRETSSLVNAITPASGLLGYGIFCVLEAAAADDHKAWATFTGFVEAYIIKASGNVAPGDALYVTTAGNLSPDGSIGHKQVAFYAPLDGSTLTAPTTRTRARVYFDGINGIGTHGG